MDERGSFLSTTKAQVEAAIAQANAILKQAGIKLNIKHVNDTVNDLVANAGNAGVTRHAFTPPPPPPTGSSPSVPCACA